jgi:hypothetical protein
MNQIGLVTGFTVGASVLLVYALLQRAAANSAKRGRRNDGCGDSSGGDSGSSFWSGDSNCGASDSGGSCDGGGGGDGGGD